MLISKETDAGKLFTDAPLIVNEIASEAQSEWKPMRSMDTGHFTPAESRWVIRIGVALIVAALLFRWE